MYTFLAPHCPINENKCMTSQGNYTGWKFIGFLFSPEKINIMKNKTIQIYSFINKNSSVIS